LRYLVTPGPTGVEQINAVSAQVQGNLLEGFGLAAETKFRKGQAVAAR